MSVFFGPSARIVTREHPCPSHLCSRSRVAGLQSYVALTPMRYSVASPDFSDMYLGVASYIFSAPLGTNVNGSLSTQYLFNRSFLVLLKNIKCLTFIFWIISRLISVPHLSKNNATFVPQLLIHSLSRILRKIISHLGHLTISSVIRPSMRTSNFL